ncbi:MAG: XRE family transcriptional regulator [Pseudorhodoplanes sp.]|jgi:Zn-dependent peptidase ImmA (M78 family)/DNA-binding XRE family transcriptional regulator|nr:XRE family transcriptional regulator [Pseudorhodoplanes sp.]
MSGRIKALVEPAMLVWARETASLSQEELAEGIGVAVERVQAWESDEDKPSIAQLRKIAKKCKRPLSVFYLPEPPQGFQALRDFRRLAAARAGRFSSELAYEVRAAHERRLVALEVLETLGEQPDALGLTAGVNDNAEVIGMRIRERLGITLARQSRWGDTSKAFRAWRDAIEGAGVLVSVIGGAHHQIDIEEMRGFAIADQPLPMIVVNGKDRSGGRIFTLLHELGHIILGQSVIENTVEPGDTLPAPVRAMERFCNQVAAASLMPRDDLLAEAVVRAKTPLRSLWSDEEIESLARRYGVSREALLVRLVELRQVTNAFYQGKRAEYARQREEEIEEAPSGFAPYRQQVLGYIGRGFARLVLQGYHNNQLTLSAVSGYLGVQAKYVPPIERLAFGVPA